MGILAVGKQGIPRCFLHILRAICDIGAFVLQDAGKGVDVPFPGIEQAVGRPFEVAECAVPALFRRHGGAVHLCDSLGLIVIESVHKVSPAVDFVPACPLDEVAVVGIHVVVGGEAVLFQVVLAGGTPRSLPCLIQSGQQEPCQNGNDCNNNQKFNKSE